MKLNKKEISVVLFIGGFFLLFGIILAIATNKDTTSNNVNNNNIISNNTSLNNVSNNVNNTNTNKTKEQKQSSTVSSVRNEGKTLNFSVYTHVNDTDDFYNAEGIALKYFDILARNNGSEILNLLDDLYISKNKLNSANVLNKLNESNESIGFCLKDLYEISNKNIVYYFLNGFSINTDILGENIRFVTDVNLLIAYDFNNYSYKVTPLDSDIDILSYVRSYKAKDNEIKQNTNNKYLYMQVDKAYVFSRYISYYQMLLFMDPEKAYNMLTDDAKESYQSYDNFVNNSRYEIYNNFDTRISSFKYMQKDDKNYYIILTKEKKQILLFDSSLLDFKISFVN